MVCYLTSFCNFRLGSLVVDANTAPGILQLVLFSVILLLNIILFEEVPENERRVTLNNTNANLIYLSNSIDI